VLHPARSASCLTVEEIHDPAGQRSSRCLLQEIFHFLVQILRDLKRIGVPVGS
jgi:hypothetical protein